MKRTNLVVYTSIFANRDELKEPPVFPGVDYVCFTDNSQLQSKVWNIIPVDGQKEDPRRTAKVYKILPHRYFPQYDYSLWVDGSHIPAKNPWKLVDRFLARNHLALFSHKHRNCIYDEARECLAQEKDNPKLIISQIAKYYKEGFPRQGGLATCTVILRRHNREDVRRSMEEWWREIVSYSVRDQLSFNYVMRKNNLQYSVIPGDVYRDPYFSFQHHIGEGSPAGPRKDQSHIRLFNTVIPLKWKF